MPENDVEYVPFSFADLDLKNAPDDPFAAPIGTWPARLTEVPVFRGKKDPEATFMKFVWVHREGLGKLDYICQLPDGRDPAEDVKRRAKIKAHLLALEVAEEDMDTLETENLIGTCATITTRRNGQYTNITKIELDYAAASTDPSGDTPVGTGDAYDYMSVFSQTEPVKEES